jgi:hypothetical protein
MVITLSPENHIVKTAPAQINFAGGKQASLAQGESRLTGFPEEEIIQHLVTI